ncbi:MAG: hypothetical protein LBR39_03855 [Coriobacteriales bacterium]|nr:hypothetical protein [Coriobacteriales bacterium]
MSIVQAAVQRLGGTIEATSTPGEKTTFTVTI